MYEGSVGPISQNRGVPPGYGLDFQIFEGGGGVPAARLSGSGFGNTRYPVEKL